MMLLEAVSVTSCLTFGANLSLIQRCNLMCADTANLNSCVNILKCVFQLNTSFRVHPVPRVQIWCKVK